MTEAEMRLPRIKFTVRSLMVAVALCAAIVWVTLITVKYWWTWTVVRDVRRGQSQRYSAEGFSRAGPLSIQALRDALKSDKKATRLDAMQSIAAIGRDPREAIRALVKPAVPDLIDALKDKDDEIRMFAADALGQMGPSAASAVVPLMAALQDEQHPVVSASAIQVSAIAIQALGEIGPSANSALPALAKMVEDPQHRFHIWGIQAFWRIGPKGPAEASIVVPKLIDRLSTSKDPRERAWLAGILTEIGPAAGDAVPALTTAAADPDPTVRVTAKKALSAVTAAAEKHRSATSTSTQDP
jgi:HEAT repeat protein